MAGGEAASSEMVMKDQLPYRELILNGRKRTIYGSSADDPYFSTLANEGEWPFLRFCERYLRDEYNCLDIGANVGLMTSHMSEYCTSGKIICVEPNRAIFSALQKNIEANGIKNAAAVNAAVSEQDGELRFTEESASGHIDPAGTAVVESVTLSTLLARHGIDRVDFIKMDVEGYEPVLLRGNLDVLKRDKPLVFLEFHSLALIMETRTEPLGFLEWILQSFAHVFMVTYRPPAPELLTRITPENVRALFYDNVMKHGCVDDLLVTDDPEKLTYCSDFPDRQSRRLQRENEIRRKASLPAFLLARAKTLWEPVSRSLQKRS
jgi:FkbM family methyltransferase